MTDGPLNARSAVVVGAVLIALYLLLGALVLLTAAPLLDRFGPGPVQATVATLGALTWVVAGVAGSRAPRRAGAPRTNVALTAFVGAGAGYALGPGLVSTSGLVLGGAGATALLTGPLLSVLLAAAVAAAAAALSPHAPAPAPYVDR